MNDHHSIVKSSLKFPVWGIRAGLLWAVYEVGLRSLVPTGTHGGPGDVLNLLSAAMCNYFVVGLVLGLAAMVYSLAARVLRRNGPGLSAGVYFVSAFVVLILVLWLGIYINRNTLARVSVMHPLSLAVSAGIVVAGFFLSLLLYKLIQRVLTALQSSMSGFGNHKALRPGLLILPFLLLGAACILRMGSAGGHDSFSAAARGEVEAGQTAAKVSADGEGRIRRNAGAADGLTMPLNVILLTIETLRADHLNIYGYEKRLNTPNIDALSRQGVTFMRNYSQSSWTKPSVVSIMSSLYPQQHGINNLTTDVQDTLLTLPVVLKQHGYQTASLVTNGLAKSTAFGFEETFYNEINRFFSAPKVISPFSYRPLLVQKLVGEVPLHNAPVVFPDEMVSDWYIDTEKVNHFLKHWLAERDDRPVFLHLHLFDPHEPYLNHPYEKIQLNLRTGWNRERLETYYDREIEYLDEQIGVLLDLLAKAGLRDNGLIIFTSDHGEEFLDHGGWGHGKTLFEETIHVPLILTFSDHRYAGKQIQTRVSNIDIAPTVLDVLGIAAPSVFQGNSLLGLLEEPPEDDRVIISHVQNPTFESTAIIKGGFKYINTRGLNDQEFLFELRTDPRELNNLIAARPEIAAELQSDLLGFAQQFRRTQLKSKKIELTEEQKKRLRALGYLK